MSTTNDRIDSLFTITDQVDLYYQLNIPLETHLMPEKLIEISGISWYKDQILCVEDEHGRVYVYHPEKKKITAEWKFGSDGDYEDLVMISNTVFVLKSDGDIYEFEFPDKNMLEVKKYENKLSQANDTEGLACNPTNNNLLIACKENKDLNGKELMGAPIYSFSLSDKKVDSDPFYLVNAKSLKSFFESHRNFTYQEERIIFKPSAIAYNPLDHHYYILASVGKLMIVLNDKKEIKATYSIPSDLLIQPEGITFGSQGELWISSEGKDGSGRILKFSPIRKKG